MAAKNSLNAIQFHHTPPRLPKKNQSEWTIKDDARIAAVDVNTGREVGSLLWNDDQLENVYVDPAYQRKGIATEMWKQASQLSQDQPFHYPPPYHSRTRTPEGDEWAWSIYGRGLSEKPPELESPEEYGWDIEKHFPDDQGN